MTLLMGTSALAQELPKKTPADEPAPDATLFANPPIKLVEPAAPSPGITRILPEAAAPKPTTIELQLSNVERLRAQVAALRKRSTDDPSTKDMLNAAETALRSAESLAADAEAMRTKTTQAEAASARAHSAVSRIVTPPKTAP